MAQKPDRDVTRRAVEKATPAIAKARDLLKTIIYTGPDQIMMTNNDILQGAADGNPNMLKHLANADVSAVDNKILDSMLEQGLIGNRQEDIMVLPRTPGGLPGAGNLGARSGPQPGQARGIPQTTPGPEVPGVPNPDKLVELFTGYTSGQMSREDLIGQLHTFSQGQGGILGLLEGMEKEGKGNSTGSGIDQMGGVMQPNQSMHTIPGSSVPGGASLTGPGKQPFGPIPQMTEPLDKRHQRISQLLQTYGIVPEDADQMSTELNPNEQGVPYAWEQEQINLTFGDDPRTSTGMGTGNVTKQGAFDAARASHAASIKSLSDDQIWDVINAQAPNAPMTNADINVDYTPRSQVSRDQGGTMSTGWEAPEEDDYEEQVSTFNVNVQPNIVWDPVRGQHIDTNKMSLLPPPAPAAPQETGQLVWDNDSGQMVDSGTWMPPKAGPGLNAAQLSQAQNPGGGAYGDMAQQATQNFYTQGGGAVGDMSAAADTVRATPAIDGGAYGDMGTAATNRAMEQGGGAYGDMSAAADTVTQRNFPGAYGDAAWTAQYTPPVIPPRGPNAVMQDPNQAMGFIGSGNLLDPLGIINRLNQRGLRQQETGRTIQDPQGPITAGGPNTNPNEMGNIPDNQGNMPPVDPNNPAANPYAGNRWSMYTPEWMEGHNAFMEGYRQGTGASSASGVLGDAWMRPTDDTGATVTTELGQAGPMFDPKTAADPAYKAWQDYVTAQNQAPDWAAPEFEDTMANEAFKSGQPRRIGGQWTTGIRSVNDPGSTDRMGVDFSSGSYAYPELTALMSSFTPEALKGQQGMTLGGKLIEAFARLGDARITGQISEADRNLKASIAHFDQIVDENKQSFDEEYKTMTALGEHTQNVPGAGRMLVEREDGTQYWAFPQETKLTVARKAEEFKQAMQIFAATGYIPQLDETGTDFIRNENGSIKQDATTTNPTLERELSFAELEQKRETDMSALFGTLVSFGDLKDEEGKQITGIAAGAETLPGQEFAFTKLLKSAELAGRMMEYDDQGNMVEMTGADGKPIDTFAARRYAWDSGVQKKQVTLAQEQAELASERANLEAATAQYGQDLQSQIAAGQLQEAVTARKELTLSNKRKDDLALRQLKVNTLLALADPSTMLFAKRYGLFDHLGAAIGVNFDDEDIPEPPPMVEPGTYPTMKMLQDATPGERQIMLAEVASFGGDMYEHAASQARVEDVRRWTPGSTPLRRNPVKAVSR